MLASQPVLSLARPVFHRYHLAIVSASTPRMSSSRYPHRYTHETSLSPTKNNALYKQGKGQGEMSLERYHTLCAAIQRKYEFTDVPADFSKGQLFPRKGITFDHYTSYNLEPVLGIKLHPRQDGTIHPGDIKVYKSSFVDSWKCREGGILYCIGEAREFWNMVLNYHSTANTTGMRQWDKLFERLRKSDFDKSLIPCMVRR